MGFRDKLIDILLRTATGTKKVKILFTLIGAGFFFCIVLIFIILPLVVDKLLNLPRLLPEPLNLYISVPVMLAGLGLMWWSLFHFLKVRGTPVPFNPPPRLVTTGPYAFARNPMMTGLFVFMFGLGIMFRSISLTLIFTPLFILLGMLELRAIEEPELEKRLGDDYLEYKKRVPMFVPRIKLKTNRTDLEQNREGGSS